MVSFHWSGNRRCSVCVRCRGWRRSALVVVSCYAHCGGGGIGGGTGVSSSSSMASSLPPGIGGAMPRCCCEGCVAGTEGGTNGLGCVLPSCVGAEGGAAQDAVLAWPAGGTCASVGWERAGARVALGGVARRGPPRGWEWRRFPIGLGRRRGGASSRRRSSLGSNPALMIASSQSDVVARRTSGSNAMLASGVQPV